MESEIAIVKPDYPAQTLARMNRLRHENAHCDFIIKVDGVEIPVHKLVVCANSDYFNAMLSHQETLESKSGIVEMKETDIESVKICIDFIYTGRAKFPYKNAERVLYNAKLFQLGELCEEIVDFLVKNLRAGTFFHSKKMATKYNCGNLDKICDEFAVEHFEEIASENYFVLMNKRYIVCLLKSKKLKVSENVKLASLVKWIKHDLVNRREIFKEMLKGIQLGQVPISYRKYLVENEDLVGDSLECMKLFTKSFCADVEPKDYEASKSEVKSKLSGLQGIGVVDYATFSINIFDPFKRNLIANPALGIPHFGNCTMLSLNDDIYVLLSGNQSVHKLCYTKANATWQQMQSMKYRHDSLPPAVVLRGLIYVVGSRFAERYDPANNTWSELPQCNALIHSSLAATSNAIYKIGGRNKHNQPSIEVQKYDPNSFGAVGWCSITSLYSARVSAPAIGHNNKIYVLGGNFVQQPQLGFVSRPGPQSIECYDETNNTWTIIRGMQLPYSPSSACVVNGDIYACGRRKPDGFGGQASKNTLLKLDFEKNSSEKVFELENNPRIFTINMVQ